MPKVSLSFGDRLDLPEENVTTGINIILSAAEGEVVADADVQKSALRVIVNCVCAPINRVCILENANSQIFVRCVFKSSLGTKII